MESKNIEMWSVFEELSEHNQDIMILLAKGIQFAQQTAEKKTPNPKKSDPVKSEAT